MDNARGPARVLSLWRPELRERIYVPHGLIRRREHPDDRRSIVIELTEQGRALVPRLPPVFGRVTSQLLAGFAEQEVRQLTTMLQRML